MKAPHTLVCGFSLVEMALVLGIIGLLLFFMLPTNTTMMVSQRRSTTIQKLANIESALLNYVILNKRLPCPADGTLLTGAEGTRDGNGDCTTAPVNQGNGVVPWVTLGMALNDVLDSWDNQITYRVGYGLTRNAALDMSSCDPAGTALETVQTVAPAVNLGLCRATCTGTFAAANCTSPQNFLQRKGLDVRSNAATTVMNYTLYTGAAYVLVSHGENGYGAINNNGFYRSTAMIGVAGTTLENANRNLAATTVTANAPPSFISANYNNGSDVTTYFDDIVVKPLLFSVISKAQLGPRSH